MKHKYEGVGDLCLAFGEAGTDGSCYLCGARRPCPNWADVERSMKIENGIPLSYPPTVEKPITFRGIEETPINQIKAGMLGEVVVAGLVYRIEHVDDNAMIKISRRGGRRLSGPSMALNVFVRDDRGNDVLCRVGRFDYNKPLAQDIINYGRVRKALWFFAGTVPLNFRMIRVQHAKLIGDMDEHYVHHDRS
jgi:hypothetical protein